MKRFIAPLAVLVLAGIAPLAQANIQISYSIVGGASGDFTATAPVFGHWATSGDVGGPPLMLNLSATSTSPGTLTQSKETGGVGQIANEDVNPHTVRINIVAQDFANPVTTSILNFTSYIAGEFVGGSGNSLTFQSCVDQNNHLVAAGGGCPATYHSLESVVTTGAFNITQKSTVSVLSAPYAIDEFFDITIGAGATLQFTASSTLSPVPEPMSIALLGGVVLLTSRLIRRKRNQVS